LDRGHLLIKRDISTILGRVDGVGPSWWVHQINVDLTVLTGLGDWDAFSDASDVVIEGNVDVRPIAGQGTDSGASRAPGPSIVHALDVNLIRRWVWWLGGHDWVVDRDGHSAQEERRKSQNASGKGVHFGEVLIKVDWLKKLG